MNRYFGLFSSVKLPLYCSKYFSASLYWPTIIICTAHRERFHTFGKQKIFQRLDHAAGLPIFSEVCLERPGFTAQNNFLSSQGTYELDNVLRLHLINQERQLRFGNGATVIDGPLLKVHCIHVLLRILRI